MAEPPDLAQLAKRYLDLWETQLAAFGSDPALLDQVARTVAAMGATLVAASAAAGQSEDPGHGRSRKQDAAATARAPAAAAASSDGDARLDQFARQLADLERRLAGIEATLAGKPGSARPQSRKPRS